MVHDRAMVEGSCQGAQSAPGGPCIATACRAEPGKAEHRVKGRVDLGAREARWNLLVIFISTIDFKYG